MMHARTKPVSERDIMHSAFAMRPSRPETAGLWIFGVFGDPKAEIRPKRHAVIDMARKHIEMIDPQRFDAVIKRIILMN